MYIPSSFAETNLSNLHDAMQAHSFATLISQTEGTLSASHLPLLLDRGAGEWGTLIGHMARANPQWKQAAGGEVLAIFSGPHAYISPTWYADSRTVPTWNYVAVHAYGRLELVENPEEMLWIVQQMVETYEANLPRPWSLQEPAEFVNSLLAGIIGFRIRLTRLEGKWKLNQNHPPDRRRRTISALAGQTDENSQAISRLMAAALLPDAP